ncbi:MAG: Gfo/Idh/MocA family oxidoreductase [Chloroflexota bacterium]
MSSKPGIAVIGCGYWGINYVRVFNELPGVHVAAICDQREERLQEVGQQFPGAALVTNVDDLLKRKDVDGIVLCTPAMAHYDVTKACLKAGKHILVEKPITTKAVHAEDLIDIAEHKDVTLMVGHTFLFNGAVQKVKEWVDKDDMDRVYYLYSRRTNLGPIRHDVNALWDLAPHDISIFNYLLDQKPQWVSATGSRVLQNEREDVGFVSLGYEDDIVGHIHVSWVDPNKVREMVVVGSNRRIVFDDTQSIEQVRVFEKGIVSEPSDTGTFGEFRLQVRNGDIISPHIEISEPLKNQCLHFLECINQKQRPVTDGQAGLAVVEVMEAIDQSIKQHGIPVELN